MLDYMEQLAKAYSDRVALQDVGVTYEKRPLKSLTITNGDGRDGKKAILLIAGAHAREWLTPVAALYTLEQLVVRHEENAHLLHDYDWIVMPQVNPDGYMYSRNVDKLWRNTRSPNGFNCFGTNINRNYDIGWGQGYAELNDSCTMHYAGSKPFSEPETRAVRDKMLELVQSKRGMLFITLHSHHTSIFYPWVYKSDTSDNDNDLHDVAEAGAEAIFNATGTRFTYGQYGKEDTFGGTSLDYAYSIGFPLSYAFELSGERDGLTFDFWPPKNLLKDLADESWVGISAMAEKAIELQSPDRPITVAKNSSSSYSLANMMKIILLMTIITVLSR
ncbi:zinc carboxypeptidase A 1-like [Drosophila hydei]|nr:zinc carboxypeptidase A 1-like [Drosophila hydei]